MVCVAAEEGVGVDIDYNFTVWLTPRHDVIPWNVADQLSSSMCECCSYLSPITTVHIIAPI